MNYTDLHYQTAISLLFGIGPIRGKELIVKFEDLSRLFQDDPESLSKESGYRVQLFREMDRQGALDTAENILEFNERHGIRTLFHTHPDFPYRLNKTPDGPLLIYQKGECDLNEGRFVALVGTREPSDYGQEVCEQLINSFDGLGIKTVSGLAYGIDTWAHRFSVDRRIQTIATLGHGLDRIYPVKNKSIAKQIIDSRGALITEFPPGTNPDRENFPKRNRIVAGLTDATIVIESKRTGGSLITARLANDYNRDVFAVPGTITKETSRGCNMLIENDEAHLLESPESFLKKMGWFSSQKKSGAQRSLFPDVDSNEKAVIDYLKFHGKQAVDVLALALHKTISELQVTLFMLEMKGIIRNKNGLWVELIP